MTCRTPTMHARRSSNVVVVVVVAAIAIGGAGAAHAMCGCMIAPKPPLPRDVRDAKPELVSDSARVALVRDGDDTVMTIGAEVRTRDIKKFALIIPVPTPPTKDTVHVADAAIFHDIEAATRTRFVTVSDPSPCGGTNPDSVTHHHTLSFSGLMSARSPEPRAADYGVVVEDHFDVGEYGIAILSAKDSAGLIDWLRVFKYDVPKAAADVIGSYLAQGMHFFVARVSLEGQHDRQWLRPLVVRYHSPKFVLPIRLGMVNADGPQEVTLFALSKKGRIEPANYRVVRSASDVELPGALAAEKNAILRESFVHAADVNKNSVVFLEYAGVARQRENAGTPALALDRFGAPWSTVNADTGDVDTPTYVSRLHFRYERDTFPEDVVLQETTDTAPFEPTITFRDEGPGDYDCPAGVAYAHELAKRREQQVTATAALTGRDAASIRAHFWRSLAVPTAALPAIVDAGSIEDPSSSSSSCVSCGRGGAPVGAFVVAIVLRIRVRMRRRR